MSSDYTERARALTCDFTNCNDALCADRVKALAAEFAAVAEEARREAKQEAMSAGAHIAALGLAEARAEGRRQGLEEAAAHVEGMCDYDTCSKAIRALAGGGA